MNTFQDITIYIIYIKLIKKYKFYSALVPENPVFIQQPGLNAFQEFMLKVSIIGNVVWWDTNFV